MKAMQERMNWEDKEQVLAVVRRQGWALKFVCTRLQEDKEIILEVIKELAWALQYTSEKLKDDREVKLTYTIAKLSKEIQKACEGERNKLKALLGE